ncbi:MAG: ribosome recycling factor [Verrucomicrobiales bacterium]|nr:ribosome recycling factor [Verrucomicrobiales bacterium]MED5585212.1 ribosome recycling factor [Verrucomicrobiota bacterium]
MDKDTLNAETQEAMRKAVEYTLHEFSSVRTGKASPALVENIDVQVQSYGSTMKLKQLAVISSPEPRMLMISPFDPSTVQDIERGIKESKLGINPAVDGKMIRLPIPELSEERRKDLVKLVRQMAEEGRVRVRAARKQGMDGVKSLKSDNSITEDQQRDLEVEVQELTDKFVKEIDEHVGNKEKEIMTV